MNRMNPQLSKKISRPNGLKAVGRLDAEITALINRSPAVEAIKHNARRDLELLIESLCELFEGKKN